MAALLCQPFFPAEASAPPSHRNTNVPDIIWAVRYLTGASDEESISESELGRFTDMSERPLKINSMPRSRLLSSGLLSVYQTASLLDYRARAGDILSISELALVDGFGQKFAEALSPFISLESESLPGQTPSGRSRPSGFLEIFQNTKGSYPYGDRNDYVCGYSSRMRLIAGTRSEAGISVKPSSYAFSASYYGRRHLEQIVLGDMSLRFGQGLALWTGFSIGGFSAERSFWKRPSGISPSYSFSSASGARGVSAELSFGRAGISLFAVLPDLRDWDWKDAPVSWATMPGANVTWYSRYGQAGVTAYAVSDGRASKISGDARFCIRGTELFGEASYDIRNGKPAATAGFMMPLGSKVKTALTLRYMAAGYDTWGTAPLRMWSGKRGETGLAAGLFAGGFSLAADMAFREVWSMRQLKVNASFPWNLSPETVLSVRFQETLRSYGVQGRTDLRADLKWTPGKWMTTFRANAVVSQSFSWLTYVEEGYAGRLGAVFLRGTVFMADSWADRIYSYERDAPGHFNVPAYYGRGWSVSAAGRMKIRWNRGRFLSGVKLYARAGFTDCPWPGPGQKKPRPAKSELNFMAKFDF